MEHRVKNMLVTPHRLYKNGGASVAVLVSETCPWSTQYTNGPDPFDRDMALAIYSSHREWLQTVVRYEDRIDALTKIAKEKYPNAYMGGLRGLRIVWVPTGSVFRIRIGEDQSEYLEIFDEEDYHVA